MRKFTRVVLLVLALVLAMAPVCSAATVLTDTAWQVKMTVGSTKANTMIRFYDNQMYLRVGNMKGSYVYDGTAGKMTMKVTESQDKTITVGGQSANVIIEAGMSMESKATFNKKGNILTLSNMLIKAEIGKVTPKGIMDGLTLPITMKLTKVNPAVSKVTAKTVTSGTPSEVVIKANAAAEWFVAYDASNKVIAEGAVSNGAASFKMIFGAKKNPITVKVGLLDQSGKLIDSTLSKAKKLTVKTK